MENDSDVENSRRTYGTRAEHLKFAKKRAHDVLNEVGRTVGEALASLVSDLNKHAETRSPVIQELGMLLMMGGHLETHAQMREFIDGCN